LIFIDNRHRVRPPPRHDDRGTAIVLPPSAPSPCGHPGAQDVVGQERPLAFTAHPRAERPGCCRLVRRWMR
jgi:hypothetical protein